MMKIIFAIIFSVFALVSNGQNKSFVTYKGATYLVMRTETTASVAVSQGTDCPCMGIWKRDFSIKKNDSDTAIVGRAIRGHRKDLEDKKRTANN